MQEPVHDAGLAGKAAPRRDHVAALVGQRFQDLRLELAEVGLAPVREDLGMERPSRAVIIASVSTKQRPRRRASMRPTVDFPAPMKPTRMTFRGAGMAGPAGVDGVGGMGGVSAEAAMAG